MKNNIFMINLPHINRIKASCNELYRIKSVWILCPMKAETWRQVHAKKEEKPLFRNAES